MTGRGGDRSGWSQFWAPQGAGKGGCMASSSGDIPAILRRTWTGFAQGLGPNPRLIDIATGDGQVMGWIVAGRTDVAAVGVDLADPLPPPPAGTRSIGGVAMESLPFRDSEFDVAVSQFGLEYGDLDRAIAELCRVVRPGGSVALLTHRFDGPIVTHNRARREGLQWSLDDQGLIARARAGLALRGLGVTVPPALLAIRDEAIRRYGHGSAGWELAEAVVRTMAGDPRAIEPSLHRLEAMARGEIARVAALEAASEAIAEAGKLVGQLRAAGLDLTGEQPLGDGRAPTPFADFRTFRRH